MDPYRTVNRLAVYQWSAMAISVTNTGVDTCLDKYISFCLVSFSLANWIVKDCGRVKNPPVRTSVYYGGILDNNS